MELRKDPVTRSWVVVGHPEHPEQPDAACPLCPGNEGENRPILSLPPSGQWQVRVLPHLKPLYRIEGDPGRSAEGIYDRMELLGAHEIIVESRDHARSLPDLTDEEIERLGSALMKLEQKMDEMKKVFGLTDDDLNLKLGPVRSIE